MDNIKTTSEDDPSCAYHLPSIPLLFPPFDEKEKVGTGWNPSDSATKAAAQRIWPPTENLQLLSRLNTFRDRWKITSIAPLLKPSHNPAFSTSYCPICSIARSYRNTPLKANKSLITITRR